MWDHITYHPHSFYYHPSNHTSYRPSLPLPCHPCSVPPFDYPLIISTPHHPYYAALAMWDHITYHPIEHIFGATYGGDFGIGGLGVGTTGRGGVASTMLVQELLPAFRGRTVFFLAYPYPVLTLFLPHPYPNSILTITLTLT